MMTYKKEKCIIESYIERDLYTREVKILFRVHLFHYNRWNIEENFDSLEAAKAFVQLYSENKYREEFYI